MSQEKNVQDMPPTTGFPRIEYRRNVPTRGPRGAAIYLGAAAIMTYGWAKFIYYGRIDREERIKFYEERQLQKSLVDAVYSPPAPEEPRFNPRKLYERVLLQEFSLLRELKTKGPRTGDGH